jgi:hypothetical protein
MELVPPDPSEECMIFDISCIIWIHVESLVVFTFSICKAVEELTRKSLGVHVIVKLIFPRAKAIFPLL